MKPKELILTTFFTLIISVLFAQDEFTLIKQGELAPDFSFESLPGKTHKLSDLKGKVVWINFFATWCPPCREELPILQKQIYEKYKNNKDFELIILGREHNWDEINKFKQEQKYTMPFYPDPERNVFSVYAEQNIPRNFIIGKDGRIVTSSIGFEKDEFEKIVKKVETLLN